MHLGLVISIPGAVCQRDRHLSPSTAPQLKKCIYRPRWQCCWEWADTSYRKSQFSVIYHLNKFFKLGFFFPTTLLVCLFVCLFNVFFTSALLPPPATGWFMLREINPGSVQQVVLCRPPVLSCRCQKTLFRWFSADKGVFQRYWEAGSQHSRGLKDEKGQFYG